MIGQQASAPARPGSGFSPSRAQLEHHGDADLAPGLVDLAVNVRAGTPPPWLARRLAAVDLADYPDQRRARQAVAARHHRDPAEVLLTAGASEGFVLLARAIRPRHAVIVHPQFTEPEVALIEAGHRVERVLLAPPFALDDQIPESADLVVIGNPTNPTSRRHPVSDLLNLRRPGRLLVVDEAFYDCIAGEPDALADLVDLTGLIVLRSLTKTWGLAGIRAGYLLASAEIVAELARVQPRWPVSSPALEACVACSEPAALAEAARWAVAMAGDRNYLLDRLAGSSLVEPVPDPAASFVLLRTARPALWTELREHGLATRRADTFPGLGRDWLRVAVRDRSVTDLLAQSLEAIQ